MGEGAAAAVKRSAGAAWTRLRLGREVTFFDDHRNTSLTYNKTLRL